MTPKQLILLLKSLRPKGNKVFVLRGFEDFESLSKESAQHAADAIYESMIRGFKKSLLMKSGSKDYLDRLAKLEKKFSDFSEYLESNEFKLAWNESFCTGIPQLGVPNAMLGTAFGGVFVKVREIRGRMRQPKNYKAPLKTMAPREELLPLSSLLTRHQAISAHRNTLSNITDGDSQCIAVLFAMAKFEFASTVLKKGEITEVRRALTLADGCDLLAQVLDFAANKLNESDLIFSPKRKKDGVTINPNSIYKNIYRNLFQPQVPAMVETFFPDLELALAACKAKRKKKSRH